MSSVDVVLGVITALRSVLYSSFFVYQNYGFHIYIYIDIYSKFTKLDK